MEQANLHLTQQAGHGLFGLKCSPEDASVVLIPVPWDVTTSYGAGTFAGPQAIFDASVQLDLFDYDFGHAVNWGICMLEPPTWMAEQRDFIRSLAEDLIKECDENGLNQSVDAQKLEKVNQACAKMSSWVYEQSQHWLERGKLVGTIGGDHSTPLGLIQALSERYQGDFAILHVDAHADLRNAYQGFKQSHASIMYNVLQLPQRPQHLVQVAIRDFSKEEYDLIQQEDSITCFFDRQLKSREMEGVSWSAICKEIVDALPQNVYISFDIDGLMPAFCPHTGTPVPGGLSFDQACYLFKQVACAGKNVIGFDLSEVSPGENLHDRYLSDHPHDANDEWDANVGARVLYQLCGWSLQQKNRKIKIK